LLRPGDKIRLYNDQIGWLLNGYYYTCQVSDTVRLQMRAEFDDAWRVNRWMREASDG
jgi:hypothetical protein